MTFWYHFLAQASKMQAGPSNMYSLKFRMPALELCNGGYVVSGILTAKSDIYRTRATL